MPAYHSSYNDEPNVRQIAGVSILPLNARSRGPAPIPVDPSRPDIVDEAIDLFRANSLFRNFEIKGGADRTLIYLILFISDCLSRIAAAPTTWTKHEATKQLSSHAVDAFALPGDANFPLSSLYSAPETRADADTLRQYLIQARQETVTRLLDKIYIDDVPSRWWLAFTKRKFMGKSL
ncbi:arp2 3 complex 21 kda subunit [Malassezia pachydermatis]|uniref:Actin-related protein 2/3 complex subunit 3 n=1 Tax=Malassezia pachydermatis TaxID=77020 RepID=A0A0M9VQZ4_9BASI|nr:arp2 3 complex 21 kda subunit [Malassezia pachydermatis]KOS16063.1 arp2 3 complex 21 kda subunit [Malassezia pachydermatis]